MADDILCPKCSAPNPRETAFCGKCGERLLGKTAAGEKVDPFVGTLVGDRFLVHEKLGEGGMGVVYRAEQTAIKRPVALKVLHTQLTQDDSLHARFQTEAEASSRLTHPNTVTIYDFGKTETGSLYIAMELIKGHDLDNEIRTNGALDVLRVRNIMEQACGSLADAHAHNIVHRDLKPENIMLCERGDRKDVVKVLDFGIAKVLEDDGQDQRQALTKTGMVFGTPQYMSPEQIRGEKVDHRTDIYSMGVIMYQMLVGELPFSSDTPMGALSKHLVDQPPKFMEINDHLDFPDEVEEVVMATLAKNADDRPQSMKELIERLNEATSWVGPASTAVMTGVTPGVAADTTTDSTAAGTTESATGGTSSPSSGGMAPTAATPAPGSASKKPGTPLPATQVQERMPGPAPVVSPPPAPAKKSNTGVIIGVVVALVLVTSAVLGWYLMTREPKVQPQPQQPPPVVQPPLVQQLPTQPVTPPVQPPTQALPAIPTDPVPSTNNSSNTSNKPLKDVKCKFFPTNSDKIGQAILRKLKNKESAIKECAKKGAKGRSAFSYVVYNKSNKPSQIRAIATDTGAVTSCLRTVLSGSFGTTNTSEGRKGRAFFDLKYKSKSVRKCNVGVTVNVVPGGVKPAKGRK